LVDHIAELELNGRQGVPLLRQIQPTTLAPADRPDNDGLIEWIGEHGERVTEFANRLGRRPAKMNFEQWWQGSPLLDWWKPKRR
jgi:hypothetical protein